MLAACGGDARSNPAVGGGRASKDPAHAHVLPSEARADAAGLPPFRQTNDPGFALLPGRGSDAAAFVPTGWRLIKTVRGDLDGDGQADLAMVMQAQDPANIKPLGKSGTYDANPLRIAAALFDPAAKAYVLAAEDHTVIPPRLEPEFLDAFDEIAIVDGKLTLRLTRFATLGGWGAGNRTLTFRYQNGAFYLIGLDASETQRNTGEYTDYSLNYLTRRMRTERGNIEDEKGKVTWTTLPGAPLRKMGAIGNGLNIALPGEQ